MDYPPNPRVYHVVHPAYYVIDAIEEGCTVDEVLSICSMRESFINDVANWMLFSVGEAMEDLERGWIKDHEMCSICFADLEGLKLTYLSKI